MSRRTLSDKLRRDLPRSTTLVGVENAIPFAIMEPLNNRQWRETTVDAGGLPLSVNFDGPFR